MNNALRQAARDHSIDMALKGYFSHTSQDGRTWADRVRQSGYGGRPVGETIAGGQGSPRSVVNSWIESPAHCAILLSGAAQHVGVGFASNRWTAVFGG